MIRRFPGYPIHRFVSAVFLAWMILSTSCRPAATQPVFDGDRAFMLLVKQTDLGPRTSGMPGWQRFQTMLSSLLDSLGVPYDTQAFVYADYITRDTLHFVNWIAHINPSSKNRLLIAAHYDSRPRADADPDSARRNEPITGANDGASGAAILMHLAELMVSRPPRIGVDLLFTDGEDYGPPGRENQYLLGATHFASHHTATYRFGLLLDMVGDRDLRIYREYFSERYAKSVNDKIWATAARLGVPQFVDSIKHEVLDDHLPLNSAGIPTADIIDFDYPYWHTLADTPDKCDPASLTAVGRVVLEIIYAE
jgi:glutaminyl-peptide cyclotransferase